MRSLQLITDYKFIFIKRIQKNQFEEYYFSSNSSDPIFIGRSEICSVKIESSILSKIHCSFKFNVKEKSWYVSDGNGERSSTNGTWMFCNSKFELSEETQAKIGKSVITIKKI